jgi:hypothetical protein
MSAHFDKLGNVANGELRRWQPGVVKFDLIAEGFGLLDELCVCRAAEGAFETEGEAGLQADLISWSWSLPAVMATFGGASGDYDSGTGL